MSTKKLSVIVPCYNAEHIIDRCLNSLVNQTLGLENIEIILVNDASTDGTLQVLKSWEQKYPDSILLIDSTVNMKTGGARNLGIQYASGEYIGFVDNDDWVDETMYEKAYLAAEKYDCDVVGVLYAREREDGYRFPFAMPKGKKNIPVDMTKPRPDGVSALPGEIWSKIYRRSMVVDNDLYFPEGLSYPENYWGSLLRYYIKSYYVVDEILYHYIQYEKSIIMTGNRKDILDRLEIEKRLLQEIRKRGLADIHTPQIAKNFIRRYYINTLYLSFARNQSAMPYEIYDQMKEEVLDIYPQYYENIGIRQLDEDIASSFLLRTLEYKMSDDLWDKVAVEYLNQKFDLSIFLNAEKEKRVQGTIETRELFKLGYLLFSEMQNIISDFQENLISKQTKSTWLHYEKMLQQRIEESMVIADAIRDGYRLEEEFYQPEILKQLWQSSVVAFDKGDEKEGFLILKRYWQYLELPKDLYQIVWCKGDITSFQYLPALEYCFLHADEPDLLEHARKIIFDKRSPIFPFPYEKEKYMSELGFDQRYDMFAYVSDGIPLYFPKKDVSSMEELEHRAHDLLIEQDPRSPHRYLNERMNVQEGDIVIDAGVAEGNFAASVIRKCKKLYLVECDPAYIDALKHSFRDYLDKIVFVNKYLDSYDDDEHITIDTLLNGEAVNYIKMDIEGSEIAALQGAEQTLRNATNLKCNICSYHNLHDYDKIVEILSEYNMEIEHSPGYIFFDLDQKYPYYPRRGLVQAIKKPELTEDILRLTTQTGGPLSGYQPDKIVELGKCLQEYKELQKQKTPEERKLIMGQLMDKICSLPHQKEQIYGQLLTEYFLIEETKDSQYTDMILNQILKGRELGWRNQLYLMKQLQSLLFTNSKMRGKETGSLMWKLYNRVYEDFCQELGEQADIGHQWIAREERNPDLVLVLTSQLLSMQHAPTKTALDRCYILAKHMGKQVLLINTAEQGGEVGNILLLSRYHTSYKKELLTKESIAYKDIQIPYLQCSEHMPNIQETILLLQWVEREKPSCVINIGGGSLIADRMSEILPVLTIATVFSSLAMTRSQYQMIGRQLNETDEKILTSRGKEENHVISGRFTFALKEQTRKLTRTEMGIPEDAFVLLMIGARIGQEITDELLSMLLSITGQNVFLVFVGEMDYEALVETHLSLKDHSAYLGSQSDVLAIMDLVDLYVNPYRNGGGSSVVEAMSKGVPAVTLPHGDVYVNTGETFAVPDYVAMKTTILRYMQDKEFYQRQSEEARKRADELMDSHSAFTEVMEEFERRMAQDELESRGMVWEPKQQ